MCTKTESSCLKLSDYDSEFDEWIQSIFPIDSDTGFVVYIGTLVVSNKQVPQEQQNT